MAFPTKSLDEGKSGTGNWNTFKSMDVVFKAAEKWKSETDRGGKFWLCWDINEKWCYLQQRLVLEQGWTPIVGWDPHQRPQPKYLATGALSINFNEVLQLPVLFMHVPLEFAFLWVEKLAFWHSDLILPRNKLNNLAKRFEKLKDGEMSAVRSYGGIKNFLKEKSFRYFELIGCTTKGASRDQFEKGAGWWRHIAAHINAPKEPREQKRRRNFIPEHGYGIRYWEKYYEGKVYPIKERYVHNGHFSGSGKTDYIRGTNRGEELDLNFDLSKIASKFEIHDLLLHLD